MYSNISQILLLYVGVLQLIWLCEIMGGGGGGGGGGGMLLMCQNITMRADIAFYVQNI